MSGINAAIAPMSHIYVDFGARAFQYEVPPELSRAVASLAYLVCERFLRYAADFSHFS
jgi:hypothetical protein